MRKDLHMLIALLMAALLPLQAGLVLARSIQIATQAAPEPATARVGRAVLGSGTQDHGMHGLGTHGYGSNDHFAHHHAAQDQGANSAHGDMTKPDCQGTGSKAGGCGAKCCLAGFAAPPPVFLQHPPLDAGRMAFVASFLPPAGFIPDGPERPPRSSLS